MHDSEAKPLRIALAGLGTVGAGVLRLLETNRAVVEARAGRPFEVVAVSARDRHRDRGVDLSPYAWCDDMTALAERDDVDVVVELVGGSDGPALALARRTLDAGKSLVTANKAMVAHHGMALAEASAIGGGAPFRPVTAPGGYDRSRTATRTFRSGLPKGCHPGPGNSSATPSTTRPTSVAATSATTRWVTR